MDDQHHIVGLLVVVQRLSLIAEPEKFGFAVVGVIHLGLGEVRADVPRQRQCVIVVDDGKLALCFAHVRSLL